MYIKQDMDFNDLTENCWSGAIDTLKAIEEHGKEEELMQLLEDAFDECPDIAEINDYLWFSDEDIFECLGISESEDEEEEEEIDYEEGETEKQCVTFDSFCNRFNKCEKCPYNNHTKTMDDCRKRYLNLKWPDDEDDEKDENGGYIVPLF